MDIYPEKVAFSLGYRVLPDGRIISPKSGMITAGRGSKLYPRFRIPGTDDVTVAAHRLAAYQKWGDQIYTPGLVVRHLNDNPTDARIENLALGTESENQMDKAKWKRTAAALKSAQFTRKHDHNAIIHAHRRGMTYRQIMDAFCVSSLGTVSFIIRKSLLANTPKRTNQN